MLKSKLITVCFIIILLLPISLQTVKADNVEITIGKIATDSSAFGPAGVLAQIAIDDINDYMEANSIPYTFTVEMKDAMSSDATHLEKIKELESTGVRFINGGGWSNMALSALPYCNDKGILLVSSSSTTPVLEIAGDNLFRFCPSDIWQGPAIASMIKKYGYMNTIVVWRGDAWGDGLAETFKSAYVKLGGRIIGDSSTRYGIEATDFSDVLSSAERQMTNAQMRYGAYKTCVLLLAFNEAAKIITQAEAYPKIYDTKWFGGDGTARNWRVHDDAPDQACHLKLFSVLAKEEHGYWWDSVAERYDAEVHQGFTYYNAFDYDIYWVIALSIAQAGYPGVDVMAVKAILPGVAAGFDGASGHILLNAYGDRVYAGCEIWGFYASGGEAQMISFGKIDASNRVTWNTIALKHYLTGCANGAVMRYVSAYSSKVIGGSWSLSVDNMGAEFKLAYKEQNLKPSIEDSPRYSVDYFKAYSRLERVVSQSSSKTVVECSLHFEKDWAKMDGTRELVESDLLATITVTKYGVTVDLPTPILGQNFDILGSTYRYSF